MHTTFSLAVALVTPLVVGAAWLVGAAVIPDFDEVPGAERVGQAPAVAATPPPLPRCDRPEHRQFDYWVGEWDVRPAGQSDTAPTPLGNIVRLEDAGCVVTEHWTAPRMTGRSVNLFDRTRGQWHQTWVDSTGGLHEYWGAANGDGDLVLHGTRPVGAAGNARQALRVTFFNLGPDRRAPTRIRQFAELLGADGKWTTSYDLSYTRRTPAR